MDVAGDPAGDNKYEHVQFAGSWCFYVSRVGWRTGREEL